MGPEESFRPVTQTIDQFINTGFSAEQYAKLASQMTGSVKDTPLIESFTRKFLAQTGYMYHFAPTSAREDILDRGIKMAPMGQEAGRIAGKSVAWFSPNPTLSSSMIGDLLADSGRQGLDVFRVKTTSSILSKTFLDPYHRFAGKTSSSIMSSFEASGKSAKGLNFLFEYMKGAVGAGIELESLKKYGFDVPVAESLAVVGDSAERLPAELFIPGVKSSREFQAAFDQGARTFEDVLAKRISDSDIEGLITSMSPEDRKLSQGILAQVRAAKSESIRALEGIDAVTTTSAKLTPKTFNKIIKSGDVAASVMRFARGL